MVDPNPRREELLRLVRTEPGLHLSEIARRLHWSTSLAEYYLRILEREGVASSRNEGGQYPRYYAKEDGRGRPAPAFSPLERKFIASIRHPIRHRIIELLARAGAVKSTDVAQQIGRSRPATSYHLRAMERNGIVLRDFIRRYVLVEHALATRLLASYRPAGDQVEALFHLFDEL